MKNLLKSPLFICALFFPVLFAGNCQPEIVQQQPVYHIRLHAIVTSDTDGSRKSVITGDQIGQWVDYANNALYKAGAGMVIDFDESETGPDYERRNDTDLNNVSSNGTSWDQAGRVTADYPGKLVVFFRFGTGVAANGATGNGFAFGPSFGSGATSFIGMPGDFNATAVRNDVSGPQNWVQNIAQLTHDIGHFFDLGHTFPGSSDVGTGTKTQAEQFIQANGNSANAMDGDGISDTPPDAGTTYYQGNIDDHPCGPTTSYSILGINFTPPRNNIMSYFACGMPEGNMIFTAGQVTKMRATLQSETRRHLIEVPCGSDFANIKSENWQLCFNYWRGRGFWPEQLSTYAVGDQAYVAGIMRQGSDRPVRTFRSQADFATQVAQLAAQNWYPKSTSVITTSGGPLYSAVWAQSDSPSNFYFVWNQSAATYSSTWNQMHGQGFVQVDFNASANGTQFAGAWVRQSGPNQAHYFNLTQAEYQTKYDDFYPSGLRVVFSQEYATASGSRFGAIWNAASGNWVNYVHMSSSEFQSKYDQFSAQGYQLKNVTGAVESGQIYLSAVWYKP